MTKYNHRCHRWLLPFWIAGAMVGLSLPVSAYTLQNLTQYVTPFCGTDNGGNCFPGAVVPFGMMQWSPDTTSKQPGGFNYNDTQICGFSFDHLSGAGGNIGSDLGFTPILGGLSGSPVTSSSPSGYLTYASTWSGRNASPGYFDATFANGIITKLTATTRSGFAEFTYPSGNTPTMLINAGSGTSIVGASLQINASGNEVSGYATNFGFLGSGQHQTVYFDVVFDHSFSSYGMWNGTNLSNGATSESGTQIGAYLNFNLSSGGTVLARSAVSWVSVANAKANLAAESPASSFNSSGFSNAVIAASNEWNAYLNKIQVSGGSSKDTQAFYCMLYHSLIAPCVVSDDNKQYIGFDGSVHTTSGFTKYEYFSGWDIYRTECQLIAMLAPSVASDMAQSLVQDATEGGAMPRWSLPTGDTGTMIGDDATPIIAGMYAFGATDFDTSQALTAMENAAVNPVTKADNNVIERDANSDYLNLGYVPMNQSGGYGPASMTLEYDSDDAALALFARSLGNTADYLLGLDRAQNWHYEWNNGSGYLQLRESNGSWTPGFTPSVSTYNNVDAWVEGTGSQYVWMVPFNLGALVNLMGGPSAASSRLNTFFTQVNNSNTSNTEYAYMGNEPCSEAPFIYDWTGEPYQCSNISRQVMQLYSQSSTGLPGNDDLGQTSSWYVWAALGFHPEIPGDDVLAINGPLFPSAVMNLPNGTVKITGTGAGDSAPYIQSLKVNGHSSNSPWIRFSSIIDGGTLTYNMATTANTNWGSSPSNAPPSYAPTIPSSPSGEFEIRNANSAQALDVSEESKTENAAVVQNPYHSGRSQMWKFTPTTGGYYQITNVNSGLDVNVAGQSTSNGADIVQWSFSSAGNDQWWAQVNLNGTYTFINLKSGLALEVPSSSTVQNTQLDQSGPVGASDQQWNLIPS